MISGKEVNHRELLSRVDLSKKQGCDRLQKEEFVFQAEEFVF
jgi:hypothetical protein